MNDVRMVIVKICNFRSEFATASEKCCRVERELPILFGLLGVQKRFGGSALASCIVNRQDFGNPKGPLYGFPFSFQVAVGRSQARRLADKR